MFLSGTFLMPPLPVSLWHPLTFSTPLMGFLQVLEGNHHVLSGLVATTHAGKVLAITPHLERGGETSCLMFHPKEHFLWKAFSASHFSRSAHPVTDSPGIHHTWEDLWTVCLSHPEKDSTEVRNLGPAGCPGSNPGSTIYKLWDFRQDT